MAETMGYCYNYIRDFIYAESGFGEDKDNIF